MSALLSWMVPSVMVPSLKTTWPLRLPEAVAPLPRATCAVRCSVAPALRGLASVVRVVVVAICWTVYVSGAEKLVLLFVSPPYKAER